MNERQIDEIIEKVLIRIREEFPQYSCRSGAYVILASDFWENRKPLEELLRKLGEDTAVTAIIPKFVKDEKGAKEISPTAVDLGVQEVLRAEDAAFPAGEFMTVFLNATRDLVVKTALCLTDDFNSEWVARCIANRLPVSMFGAAPRFTGKEPWSYKNKILSYFREAESYGVMFDKLPPSQRFLVKNEPSGKARSHHESKKIITVNDLHTIGTDTLDLRFGDIITTLAKERAKELGIRVNYSNQ